VKNKDTKYIKFDNYLNQPPPHDNDMEQVVLGACMLESKILAEVESILQPEIFYNPAHYQICWAILELKKENGKIDIVTVPKKLRDHKKLTEVGGAVYVASLTNRVGSSANTFYHTAILAEKWLRRKTIEIGHDMLVGGYDGTKDCFDGITEAQTALNLLNNSFVNATDTSKSFYDLLKIEANNFDEVASGKVVALKCGLDGIDNYLGGLYAGDLVVIAGRPGMGKTALALAVGIGAAKIGKVIPFYSYEMPALQLIQRVICDEADIDFEKVRRAKMDDTTRAMLNDKMGALANIGFRVDDHVSNTVMSIWNKSRRMKDTIGLHGIIIDYLQLMPAPELGDRVLDTARVSYLTRNLKLMAKDLAVPVIVLSQLSRAVESRPSKIPILSDLRESGGIEQDADMVLFPFRPSYYGITESENQVPYDKDFLKIIIGKNRNGALGDIPMKFIGNRQRITDYTTFTPPVYYNEPSAITQNTGFDNDPF
jgi:replicative DNA helicase